MDIFTKLFADDAAVFLPQSQCNYSRTVVRRFFHWVQNPATSSAVQTRNLNNAGQESNPNSILGRLRNKQNLFQRRDYEEKKHGCVVFFADDVAFYSKATFFSFFFSFSEMTNSFIFVYMK